MSDSRLPEPTNRATTAPATQVESPQQSQPDSQSIDPLAQPVRPIESIHLIPDTTSPDPDSTETPQRIPYWLQQAERFLRVIVRMYLGLLVCCAPWYPPAWDNNPLFASSPWLSAFVTHGAVRGIVSGLGILNLWIAVRDALRTTKDGDSN